MRHHHIPTLGDHIGNVMHRFGACGVLIGNGLMLRVFDQRIATYRDYCYTFLLH